MTTELYKRYRPQTFDEVLGQEQAIRPLEQMIAKGALPHALLFVGPSGCGKTTVARILQQELECTNMSFAEYNAADFRGIDTIREIRSRVGLAPLGGKSRIFLLDEAHKLTGDAQNSLLKLLEDTPGHVYFILCTTDPAKLIRTVITRCTQIQFKGLPEADLRELLDDVCAAEKLQIDDEVFDRIIEYAEGSARHALVNLDKVALCKDSKAQLEALVAGDFRVQTKELCRTLIKGGVRWPQIAAQLKAIDEEPESIRRAILGYANSVLLSSGNKRAWLIIEIFRDHFFDSGRAGLTAACWDLVCGSNKG